MKSYRSVITFLVALCVATALASSARAQARGSGRISGKVVDEQGQPIADVIVRARMVGETEAASGKSDKKGEWRVNGVADGQWQVELTKEGLEPVRQVVEVSRERGTLNATMTKPVVREDPSVEINAEAQRAANLAQSGKIAEARKIYEDLLVKYPTVYQLHGFIARTYAVENQSAKALDHLKIALEKEPTNVDLQLLHADLLMDSGDKVGARAILASVDMTQVKDPYPFMNSAIHLINEGKAAEAIEALTKLLPQFPAQNEIYYYRGRAYLAATKYDEAKADLEKFVAVAPTAKEADDAKKILEQMAKK
jgi:tetratricopeptide (TPR) repeat protein